MAAKIPKTMPLDDVEDEIIFTRAALSADPDARDLLPVTDEWMPWTETARAKDRDARIAVATAFAMRRVSNVRLDAACEDFGDELARVVKKADTKRARWDRFFSGETADTAKRFIRLRFAEQVSRVTGWLTGTGDDVLEKHRPPLTTWSEAGQQALDATRGTSQVRGDAAIEREETAEALTRGRDGLEATLVARANERNLPREWPKTFFKPRTRDDEDAGPPVPADGSRAAQKAISSAADGPLHRIGPPAPRRNDLPRTQESISPRRSLARTRGGSSAADGIGSSQVRDPTSPSGAASRICGEAISPGEIGFCAPPVPTGRP